MVPLAGIGKSYRNKLSMVLEHNFAVITVDRVAETLNVHHQEAGRLLSRWCKNGWLKRLTRGAYVPVPLEATSSDVVAEEPLLIVDALYAPGYIAGYSAIKHWDFSEQIFETTTYFTTRKIKNRYPFHGGVKYQLKTIKAYKLFGLKPLWFGSKKVMISDPAKTLVDILDDPKIVGGISIVCDVLAEYMESTHYEPDAIITYARRMNNKTIFKRLGFLLETRFSLDKELSEELLTNVSDSYSHLDPTIQSHHSIAKWRLKISASWKDEYDRKK